MKLNWGYVFAGISALAGIIYVTQARNATPAQVINLQPLSAPAAATNASNVNTQSTASTNTPNTPRQFNGVFPVQLV